MPRGGAAQGGRRTRGGGAVGHVASLGPGAGAPSSVSRLSDAGARRGSPRRRSYTGREHSPARCRPSAWLWPVPPQDAPARRAPLIGRHPRPVSTPTLRVAVVGAGPAGIYAADILSKTDLDVSIDLFERLPAPFGLVRYGVAPDHPRIKQIIVALHKVLERGDIRLLGNVDYGTDLTLDDLRQFYDAVIFSTGADPRRDADDPGHRPRRLLRRRRLRVLVRRPPRRPAHVAARGPEGRRPRRRQRRPRRRAHPRQAPPTTCCRPRSRPTSTTGLKASPGHRRPRVRAAAARRR